MRFTKAGQQICNVFHVRTDTPGDLGTLETIGGVFAAWWIDHLAPISTNAISLQAVEVTDVSVASGAGIEYTDGLPVAGSDNTGTMPNNVAVAVKLASGLTGRSFRGRSYYPGLSYTSLNSDKQTITTTMQTALKTIFEGLLADLVAEGMNLVVQSLFTGGAPRAAGVITDIGSVSVNPTLDSQRRRLPERGS